MKFFNRYNDAKNLGRNNPKVEGQPEPQGHVHPNYRHLTWLRRGEAEFS